MYWCRPAHEQAAWFRRNVPADPDALPPVLDLEWNGHSRTCPKKLPREEALAGVKLMLDEMEAHTGKRPMIYTDITFHNEVLAGELADYPHWLRSVAAEPEHRFINRRWMLWQYTATGRVPGIRGDVDRNAFYGVGGPLADVPRHALRPAGREEARAAGAVREVGPARGAGSARPGLPPRARRRPDLGSRPSA